jgi:hypothetical protein
MAKSTVFVDKNIKRPPGRPATGHDPEVSARVPRATLAGIEEFAAANACTRSEAMRRLLDLGLAAAQVEANRAAAPKRGRAK